jgi:hypothetical protein
MTIVGTATRRLQLNKYKKGKNRESGIASGLGAAILPLSGRKREASPNLEGSRKCIRSL